MLPLIAPSAFEDVEGDEGRYYITFLDDHPEGESVAMVPQLLLV